MIGLWWQLGLSAMLFALLQPIHFWPDHAEKRKPGKVHPDYAKIARLERELGIGEPVAEPLTNEVLPPPTLQGVISRATGGTTWSQPKSDAKCAFCIPGRPPAHGCIFYPGCRS